ncbi:hypothetical protein SH501x_000952 [Pirellulaceae bacterium SH501]
MKMILQVLLFIVSLSLITGSMTEGGASLLAGPNRFGYLLVTLLSVFVLHLLVWKFLLPESPFVGREPRSFIRLGQPRSFFTGATIFGYISIAAHYLRLAGFPPNLDPQFLGDESYRIVGVTFGLTLIGIGIIARLRNLLQSTSCGSREDISVHAS